MRRPIVLACLAAALGVSCVMEVEPSSLDDAVAVSENAIVFSGHVGTPGGKICGAANEMQLITKLTATPGLSAQLIMSVQGAVGRAYPSEPLGNETSCSGVLVASNVFMVSAQCWPGGLGSVTFNDQPLVTPINNVVDVLESAPDGNRASYRLLALAGNPGRALPVARLSPRTPSAGEQIFIVQHPYGAPVTTGGKKVIDSGVVRSVEAYLDGFPNEGMRITYDDVDTELGSSGAPVFDSMGYVIGIAEAGDCNVAGGYNYASLVSEIASVSTLLGGLDAVTSGAVDETFSTVEAPMNATQSSIPVRGNFDGDAFDDLFFYAPGMAPDEVWWGATGHRFLRRASTVDDLYYTPVVGDFDGDGYDDIFFYEPSKTDQIWFGSGLRRFTRVDFKAGSGLKPVAGDFNGDGRSDIFWYRHDDPNTSSHPIWFGNTNRTFSESSFRETGNHVIVSGDFDGNGCTDLLVQQPDTSGFGRVHLGGLKAVFPRTVSLRGLPAYLTPLPGDFDGDGRDDVLFWAQAVHVPVVYFMDGYDSANNRLLSHVSTFAAGVLAEYIYTPVVGRFDENATSDIFWYRPG